jgi:hypothetical protein
VAPNYALERAVSASTACAAGAHTIAALSARRPRIAHHAQRERQRAKQVRALALIASLLAISNASAAEISVRQLQQNRFEFVLTNPTPLSENEARALIANVAGNVCVGLTPVLGKYRFESKEAIGGDAPPSEPDSYRFTQEVACEPGAKTQTIQRRPTLATAEESQHVQDDIRARSEAYFQLIADERFDDAFVQVSTGGMGVDEATWKDQKQSFQATAGEPLRISIVKVTVYDNPAEAPEPGLYVAADFSNVYRNVPIHCGYLMWFRSIGGSFHITREETGFVTAEQLKTIPGSQLPAIKAKLRCVEP